MKLLTIILQISTSGDVKSSFNDILSSYGVPAIAFVIIASGVYGVVSNLDKIMDSEGRGTRKEGIMNTLYIIGGVALAVIIIGAIVKLVSGLTISI